MIRHFSNVSYHLYADDIELCGSFKATELCKVSFLINCLTKQWLSDIYFQMNLDKAETLIITPDGSIYQSSI